jgi:hypothetical protein
LFRRFAMVRALCYLLNLSIHPGSSPDKASH